MSEELLTNEKKREVVWRPLTGHCSIVGRKEKVLHREHPLYLLRRYG
jgi:hypothetical protein